VAGSSKKQKRRQHVTSRQTSRTAAGANLARQEGKSDESVKWPERPDFWQNILQAVGTEPRDVEVLKGASGIEHEVFAAGVDAERNRLVVISADDNPRLAALVQADIQAAAGQAHVLMARPVAIAGYDLAAVTRGINGSYSLQLNGFGPADGESQEDAQIRLQPYVEPIFDLVVSWFSNANSVRVAKAALKQLFDQLTRLKFSVDDESGLSIDFSGLIADSGQFVDNLLGTCALPLHRFSDEHMDVIQECSDLRDVQDILKIHNVYQYFYPAPDQLVLGTIDRHINPFEAEPLDVARQNGHPLGVNEIVDSGVTGIQSLVDSLRERKLLVEGEYAVELSETGKTERLNVKFTPKEGVVSKIANRFAVSVNLKNIFGLGVSTGGKEDNKK
jgi:hypothetical protein